MRDLRKSIPTHKYYLRASQIVGHALDVVPGLDDFGVQLVTTLRLDQPRELVGHIDVRAFQCAGDDYRCSGRALRKRGGRPLTGAGIGASRERARHSERGK